MRLIEVTDDDPMLAACQRAYFSEISARFGVTFDPHAGENAEAEEGQQWHFLAVDEDAALGCGSLRDLGGGFAEVKRVWVSDAARGRGVASALMTRLEETASEAGFSAIRLDTNGTLTEAQAMYKKRGYREIGRYNINPFAEHWFEKAL